MTDEQRAELKRLAEAAKDSHGAFSTERLQLADASTPAAVLDLLAENERLKAEVRRLQFELNGEEP